MAEVRVMHQNGTTIQAKVVPNMIFCQDTQDFRPKVLLSTQGGRKTSAARILKKNGRLWNMPIPEGYELAMFSPDAPALFGVPGETTNLAECTRLKLYRKCLMAKQSGITFDLTQTKDCVCALPYRTYTDVAWYFLVALRNQSGLHWFITKESFALVNDDTKPVKRRKRGEEQSSQGSPATPASSASQTKPVKGPSKPRSTTRRPSSVTHTSGMPPVDQLMSFQQQREDQQPLSTGFDQQPHMLAGTDEVDVFSPPPAIVDPFGTTLSINSLVCHRDAPTGPVGTIIDIDPDRNVVIVSWPTGSQTIYPVSDLIPALPASQSSAMLEAPLFGTQHASGVNMMMTEDDETAWTGSDMMLMDSQHLQHQQQAHFGYGLPSAEGAYQQPSSALPEEGFAFQPDVGDQAFRLPMFGLQSAYGQQQPHESYDFSTNNFSQQHGFAQHHQSQQQQQHQQQQHAFLGSSQPQQFGSTQLDPSLASHGFTALQPSDPHHDPAQSFFETLGMDGQFIPAYDDPHYPALNGSMDLTTANQSLNNEYNDFDFLSSS
eukprot:m.55238 g.55238  ORF g.55238 m.55238 type:complete len:545 (-) comp12933_c3_seq1:63-1697(-)